MNWDEKSLIISLVETAVLKQAKEFSVSIKLLLLSSSFRSDQIDVLKKNLNTLRDQHKHLKEWEEKSENINIILNDDFPMLQVSEYEKEKLHEKRIQRILLFKLYEKYRISGEKFTQFPLVSLSDLLGIDNREIYRHVSSLEREYYIRYEVCDGGQCTSDLTDQGIQLCEDRPELFEKYSVVKASIDETEEKAVLKNVLDEFVSDQRIEQLRSIKHVEFDLTRLIRLCEELNLSHQNQCYLSIAMILRTIINHIPPVFRLKTFQQVVNNYRGGKSFLELMDRLDGSLRKISDSHLHKTISKKEVLPEFTQVNFRAELDALLSEVIAVLT